MNENKESTIKLNVQTEGMDKAIAKAKELHAVLEEARRIAGELASVMDELKIVINI